MLIVLYSGYNSTPWNPLSFVKTGLGGTEQCIMSLANNLLLGTNEIYVVGNVIEGDYNNAHLVDSKEKDKNSIPVDTKNSKKEFLEKNNQENPKEQENKSNKN